LMLKRYRLDIYSPSIIDRVNIVNKESIFIHKESCEIIQRRKNRRDTGDGW
jgi:hypothetical protein